MEILVNIASKTCWHLKGCKNAKMHLYIGLFSNLANTKRGTKFQGVYVKIEFTKCNRFNSVLFSTVVNCMHLKISWIFYSVIFYFPHRIQRLSHKFGMTEMCIDHNRIHIFALSTLLTPILWSDEDFSWPLTNVPFSFAVLRTDILVVLIKMP